MNALPLSIMLIVRPQFLTMIGIYDGYSFNYCAGAPFVHRSGSRLIVYPGEEEGVAGDGLAGVGACGGAVGKGGEPVYGEFAAADFEEGADDGADHVPEKAVCRHPKVPVVTLTADGSFYSGYVHSRACGPAAE